MSDFQPGEIVNITIKGARVTNVYPRTDLDRLTVPILVADYTDGVERSIAVSLAAESVTVERAVPKARPGDLWRDRDGTLWFGVEGDDGNTYLMCSPAYSLPVLDAVREWGPLTPVHREGDAKPCGCDHHGDHAGCDADCECAP